MNAYTENTRAVVGDNRAPDAAKIVTERMAKDYAELVLNVDHDLEEARALPKTVDDDEMMGTFASLIKRLRDTAARIEAFRHAEKEPHYRSGQAVDQFFFGLHDKVARRDRKANPGAADVLEARVNDHNQRKLAAEQVRRKLEFEAQERVRLAAEEAAREAARVAEEARLAAERARAPAQIEAKADVAAKAEQVAADAAVAAEVAGRRADDAYVDTLAKPADITRTRTGDGALVTTAKEAFAEVTDYALLDMAKLWPFITTDAKDKALRAWAKSTMHNQQMAGAVVGHRPKTRIR